MYFTHCVWCLAQQEQKQLQRAIAAGNLTKNRDLKTIVISISSRFSYVQFLVFLLHTHYGFIDCLLLQKSLTLDEAVVLSSIDNEKYICALPKSSSSSSTRKIEYFGPSPQQLIKPLYDQRTCTYRIEIYWTYELCHGQYLLQYHEEKDGHRRVSRQEYYLGQSVNLLAPSIFIVDGALNWDSIF